MSGIRTVVMLLSSIRPITSTLQRHRLGKTQYPQHLSFLIATRRQFYKQREDRCRLRLGVLSDVHVEIVVGELVTNEDGELGGADD